MRDRISAQTPVQASADSHVLRARGHSAPRIVEPLEERRVRGLLDELAENGGIAYSFDLRRHRDPRHTVHYTRVAGRRFEGLWK